MTELIKNYRELGGREFLRRWKQGIQSITPLQQTKISLIGICMMLFGVIVGLISTFLTKTWWLFIILSGSLILISMNFLANIQKYFAFKKIDAACKEVEDEQESTDGNEPDSSPVGISGSSYSLGHGRKNGSRHFP